MFQISSTLRSRIDAVAVELIALSEEMQDGSPILAGVYKALGQGLDGSHKMGTQHHERHGEGALSGGERPFSFG